MPGAPSSGGAGMALVTPSYNQGPFLEAALRSVLDQGHEPLEYVVMDGGSTDGSVEILERHAARLQAWVSQRDLGQYDAINRGFAKTTGAIMGWLNSDDLQCPWALSVIAELFARFPEMDWLTTAFPLRWDDRGRAAHCGDARGYARAAFVRGENCPGVEGFFAAPIQQESTFWRRSLWEKAGALSLDFGPAGDFELWCRFMKHAELYAVTVPLAGFRWHGDQQSSRLRDEYAHQAKRALRHHFPGGQAAWYRRLRPFARDRAPEFSRSLLESLQLLHPARVITRTRDNSDWQLTRRLV